MFYKELQNARFGTASVFGTLTIRFGTAGKASGFLCQRRSDFVDLLLVIYRHIPAERSLAALESIFFFFSAHQLSKRWDHRIAIKCLDISSSVVVGWLSFCKEVTDFWFGNQERDLRNVNDVANLLLTFSREAAEFKKKNYDVTSR